MKATRTLAALVAASALLGGCASNSPQPSYANDGYRSGYDNTASTGYGTIESIQVTSGEGRTSGAGAVVGQGHTAPSDVCARAGDADEVTLDGDPS